MVAFDEQHLRDGLAHLIQRRRIVADLLSGHGGHCAGRCASAVGIDCKFCLQPAIRVVGRRTSAGDINHTKLATTMRREPLPVAQMRDVDTGCQCRIHDGLPSLERDLLPVYRDGILSDEVLFCVRAHVATLIQCELPHHRDG